MSKENAINTYEAMFLLPPTEVEEALKLCRGVIEKHQGQVLVIKKWDERKLMYELRGQKRGLYVIAFFTAGGSAVAPICRDVELSDLFLRVLVTRADHLNKDEMEKVEPQPIQPREERPAFDRSMGMNWDRPDFSDRPERGPRGPRRQQDPFDAPPAKD